MSGKNERGFTLTELMIVVSVIAVVAVIAFIGLRNNQYEGAYLRFTDDLVGTMIQARNRAIDDQTLVRVEVSVDRVEVFWIDVGDDRTGGLQLQEGAVAFVGLHHDPVA